MFGYPKLPAVSNKRVEEINAQLEPLSGDELIRRVEQCAKDSFNIHERQCFNLNPATNIMNPRAEALLSAGLGTRPSLGHPGDKYETGLEAIEEIEVIATRLATQVFNAKYAEVRVSSGALANLYSFMAICKAGDTIIAPPSSIGGHVTHHLDGCAGLYGLKTIQAPVATDAYSVDLKALRTLAKHEKPRLITIGGSLNLQPHPVADIVTIAREVGAKVLFDAAHQCGIIAGGVWENPLDLGVDIMTMSTYKSLGGPPAGLVVTNDEELAARIDKIAFPGMTANFDAANTAALAITLADWRDYGSAYALRMIDLAITLAQSMKALNADVFENQYGITSSHQFALRAAGYGGGQTASKRLRQGGFLACGIGLPIAPYDGDLNGIRIGTPELARIGMNLGEMDDLAVLITNVLNSEKPAQFADEVANWRQQFKDVHYVHLA